MVGDARNADDLRRALKGQDAVISTLGSGMKAQQKLIWSATTALLEAMPSAGVSRLVMLSTFAASPSYKATGVMKLAGLAMKGVVEDKTAGEKLLEGSDIDWTIVYATRLTDGPRAGAYRTVERNADGCRHDQSGRRCRRPSRDGLRQRLRPA